MLTKKVISRVIESIRLPCNQPTVVVNWTGDTNLNVKILKQSKKKKKKNQESRILRNMTRKNTLGYIGFLLESRATNLLI